MAEPDNMKKEWSLFVPIYNLAIADDIGGECKIDRVTFVSSSKIPRIRKRLGIPKPVSEYNRLFCHRKERREPFGGAPVFAVLRTRRADKESLAKEFNLIKEAVYILASSQFYRIKRHRRIPFGPPEYGVHIVDHSSLICHDDGLFRWANRRLTPAHMYTLDKEWKFFLKNHFFHKIMPIIHEKTKVKASWKSALKRATVLAGQSYLARNMREAFLYDMIALETLLTRRDDKFPGAIIERLVALFGWLTNEDPESWKKSVTKLYKIRCGFVHDGHVGDLSMEEVVEADMLLANLLNNLCKLTRMFRSKQDVIDFASKMAARKLLGLKPVRPRQMAFSRQVWSPQEREELNDPSHWAW